MDGFKRPTPRPPLPGAVPRPLPPQNRPQPTPIARPSGAPVLPPVDSSFTAPPAPAAPKKRRKWLVILAVIVMGVGSISAAAFAWYVSQLTPVNAQDTTVQRIEVKQGSSFNDVASTLQSRGVIRSAMAFTIFASLEGKRDAIKAGTCNLTPAYTAAEILRKITEGCHDFVSITFYPGATLETSLYAKTAAAKKGDDFKDYSIRASLKAAGYSDSDITAAFAAQYSSPLFADKPSDQGYEGYVFGETYYVSTAASVGEVLQTAFGHMNTIVQRNDLVAKYRALDLNLYEGVTLASIVGKELDCEGKPTEERKQRCYAYQQRIARVFLNRLEAGMTLGSDVTSIYASDRLGQASSVSVDSPYNTRKYAGLPPGPIAAPGELALKALANPAGGDDLYFVAGDDGLIYFATNEAGHTANIKNHCQLLCGDL